MKTFGAVNSAQASCQTGDDNPEEETQTDAAATLVKWTQAPPAPLAADSLDNEESVRQAVQGVGGQTDQKQKSLFNEDINGAGGGGGSWSFVNRTNSLRLARFLDTAGPALLALLEEQKGGESGSANLHGVDQQDVEFSQRVTVLDVDAAAYLDGLGVVDLAFAPDQPALLVTAHASAVTSDEKSNNSDAAADISAVMPSVLCVWNVAAPSAPQKTLRVSGGSSVTRCCFSPSKASVVFAGLADGTVSAINYYFNHNFCHLSHKCNLPYKCYLRSFNLLTCLRKNQTFF